MNEVVLNVVLALSILAILLTLFGVVALLKQGELRQEIQYLHTRIAALIERIKLLEANTGNASNARTIAVEDPTVSSDTAPTAFRQEPDSAPAQIILRSEGTSFVFDDAAKEPVVPHAPRPSDRGSDSLAPAETPNDTGREGTSRLQLEEIIGKRWLTWAGVLILFLSAAFFLKFAFERDLIGPQGQVAICLLVGVGLIAGGWQLLRRKMRALGQGLEGLGLAVLYATITAAFSYYEPPVLQQVPAFLLLVVVTVGGMVLAVRQNALPVALLAVIGGLATPLLVSTGHNARDTLCAYLLILDLGVLAAAFFRQWRILDSVAVLGTFCLFGGWFVRHYIPEQLTPTLGWLGTFYLLFFALPFVFHLWRRTAVTLERFLLALGNAVYTLVFCWYLLYTGHREGLAAIALLMAVLYAAMAFLFRTRIPDDRPSPCGACILSVTLLTMAVGLFFHADARLLALTIEGPALLVLGYLFGSRLLRLLSMLVSFLAMLWLCAEYLPFHPAGATPFWRAEFFIGLSVALALLAHGGIHRFFGTKATDLDGVLRWGGWTCGGLLGLYLIQAEGGVWCRHHWGSMTTAACIVILWTTGGLGYLIAAAKSKSMHLCWPGAATLLLALGALVFWVQGARPEQSLLVLNLPFLAAVATTAVLLLYAVVLKRRFDSLVAGGLAAAAGCVLLFVALTKEAGSFAYQVSGHAQDAEALTITATWGLYGVGLLIVGFWRNVRWIRYSALGIFALSAGKLLLVDMSQSEELLRILAFVLVGVLLLAASLLYHRMERSLCAQNPAPDPKNNGD